MVKKNPVRAKKQVISKASAINKKTTAQKAGRSRKKVSSKARKQSKVSPFSYKNTNVQDAVKAVKSKIKEYGVELQKLKNTTVVSLINNIKIVKDFEKVLKSIESTLNGKKAKK